MATTTRYSNNNNDRLVISTICTHLPAFHEAGFEFRTERKRRVQVVWWNPFTWGGGFEWKKSNSAAQPSINEFYFIQGSDIQRNPADFEVYDTEEVGYSKSSCISIGAESTNPKNLAQSVNDVVVTFTYNGETRTLRHSNG